jgi:hypothetical protein
LEPEKRSRFAQLSSGPHLTAVVDANRAYLRAAVPDAEATESGRWILSCLPMTSPSRLSAVSIKGMETFVLHEADDPAVGRAVAAFVIVRPSVLERHWRSPEHLEDELPGLEFEDSDYHDAGPDQVRVWGWHDWMIAALADDRFAAAARGLAESLLAGSTPYSRYHDRELADHVLGRA